MTEIVNCSRCHCQFERICIEDENGSVIRHTIEMIIQETEPVCDDCEHEFLAWTGCMPII